MQITSEAYKTEQQKQLRNEGFVNVYLGVVSKEAQSNAVAEGDFTIYSSPQEIFSNVPFEAYYETAEENVARVDGSVYFMPRDTSMFGLYQGAVTQDSLGEITFTFGEYQRLNIKGLTIDFGDYYPTSFTITNGNDTYTYTNDSPGQWTCEDEFLETAYITITPHSMVGGRQKFRILSIMFGLGFTFDNYNLISTSYKAEVAHLSDALPTKAFSFTIDNLSRQFSADNPHSFVAFLEEQQEVEFEYGRRMDDDSIETIPGGKLKLKSWSSNDTQAKFSAVGNLDYITSTYYKGRYYENGISLYDLAEDVFQDAGITNYRIDAYLKSVFTHNPLPVENHKNLIQLIANAARCILYEDRKGIIALQTSFMPDITSITDSGHVEYSDTESILEKPTVHYEYVTAEKDFDYVDAHQFFITRDIPFKRIGFVSSDVSDANGDFNSNPSITITWEAAWTFYNLTLKFSDVCPTEFTVYSYRNNTLVDSKTVTDISMTTLVEEAFYDVDEVVIEFSKTNPYQRIHVDKLSFGDITDYVLDYSDMSAFPVATRTDHIKNVNVIYSEFTYGTEKKSIGTVSVVDEQNTITYKTAYHDYSIAYKELTDDEVTYTKASKVFCDELPNVESAKTNTRYIIRKPSFDEIYMVATSGNTKSWNKIGDFVETIVDELPVTVSSNILYLVNTDTPLIYHLYLLDSSNNTVLSLGYDVRGTLDITDSGAYFVSFTSNVPSPVVVSAIAFLVNERIYTDELNELGQDKTANNVLIDNLTLAQDEAEWLAEYYDNDVEYKIQYRGEPAIDPDDQIYLENKFVEKNLVRVTSTQIDTSTGMSMSCALTARRISYQEN